MGFGDIIWRAWAVLPSAPLTPPPAAPQPKPKAKPAAASQNIVRRITEYADAPRSPKSITFTIPYWLYEWLEAMAVAHNYGSVHRSVRNLLSWARTGSDEDVEWLFGTPHEIPASLDVDVDDHNEASRIAAMQCARGDCNKWVTLDARLAEYVHHWIAACVQRFQLTGPSAILDAICRCAIALNAEHDVFHSHESGRCLPATTADLYRDLGINRSRGF